MLPDLQTIAVKLRVSESRAAAALAELVSRRLFDRRSDGNFVPHDWNEWQFKTDAADMTNAERQKRYRAKSRAELRDMKALLNANQIALGNGKRNGVTDVTIKRPETDKNIRTTIVSVERGKRLGKEPSKPVSELTRSELDEIYAIGRIPGGAAHEWD